MTSPLSTHDALGAPLNRELVLHTPRLEIVAATLALIEAELAGPQQLATALRAEFSGWPPPGNDESTLNWSVSKLREHPDCAGFYVWYVILTEHSQRRLIGMVAFKGAPDERGMIETGYSIVEEFQRRGIGTEATRAIIAWAFQDARVQEVTAETFPELRASIRVMERCGMTFYGEGSEPHAIRYGIRRHQFDENCGRD